MNITIHAGHNPDGKIACGAVGYIKESTAARQIKNEIVRLVSLMPGAVCHDITVEDGASQAHILTTLVERANVFHNPEIDLNISIHLNAGKNEKAADGKSCGVECWIYPGSAARICASRICDSIAKLGFKNRGVKESKDLYFLRKTNKPSIIIEACFVDDVDDVALFNPTKVAEAIVAGIYGGVPKEEPLFISDPEAEGSKAESKNESGTFYRVQVGAYVNKSNAERIAGLLIGDGYPAIIVRS